MVTCSNPLVGLSVISLVAPVKGVHSWRLLECSRRNARSLVLVVVVVVAVVEDDMLEEEGFGRDDDDDDDPAAAPVAAV